MSGGAAWLMMNPWPSALSSPGPVPHKGTMSHGRNIEHIRKCSNISLYIWIYMLGGAPGTPLLLFFSYVQQDVCVLGDAVSWFSEESILNFLIFLNSLKSSSFF